LDNPTNTQKHSDGHCDCVSLKPNASEV